MYQPGVIHGRLILAMATARLALGCRVSVRSAENRVKSPDTDQSKPF